MHYINNFRGIAIIMVLYGHCIMVLNNPSSVTKALDGLVGSGTIYFVIMSGFLIAEITGHIKYVDHLRNKLTYVVLPYVVVSMPAILVFLAGIKHNHIWIDMEWFNEQLNVFEQTGLLLLTGAQLGPLWFMPMIFMFFILRPVFVALLENGFLVQALIIAILAALILGKNPLSNNPVWSLVYYLPTYLLGMMLAKNKNLYKGLNNLSALAQFVLVVIWLTVAIIYGSEGRLGLIVHSCGAVLLLSGLNRYLNRRIPTLDMFAKLSFYLFFSHGYLLFIFRYGGREFESFIPGTVLSIVYFLLITIATLTFYVVASLWLGRKTRYLLGA